MKLTVGKKIIGGFLSVCLLLVFISGIAITSVKQMNDSYSEIINRRVTIQLNMKEIENQVQTQNSNLMGYLVMHDQKSLDNLEASNLKMDTIIQNTQGLLTIAANKEKLNRLGQTNQQFKQQYKELIAFSSKNKLEDTISYWKSNVVPVEETLAPLAQEIALTQAQIMEQTVAENTARVKTIFNTQITLSIITVIVALVIGFFVSRQISRPVALITEVTRRMASGDLTMDEIRVRNKDELGLLAGYYNQMVQTLRELIGQISLSTQQVAASSEELTASAEQVSKATEQIASTSQEVSTGSQEQVQRLGESRDIINEMSEGMHQVAANTQKVLDSAVQANKAAENGNEVIHIAVRQMESVDSTVHDLSQVITELGDQSNEIGQIVAVITEIASQTNLLALNAAIEAARAGEHGRGFAVVADEVRKLAEQSQESAKKISELIAGIQGQTTKAVQTMDTSSKEVAEGMKMVVQAGEAFKQINELSSDVASQAQEVSAAVQQISAGSEQIVTSIGSLNEIAVSAASGAQDASAFTEEQLASMQEITASAMALSKMAEELQQQITNFKI